jgi:hypothetical protein
MILSRQAAVQSLGQYLVEAFAAKSLTLQDFLNP